MEDKIKRAIEHIRPQLQADGGDIEFVKFDEEGKVHVKLTGACGRRVAHLDLRLRGCWGKRTEDTNYQ